jgi:hypothetical protein
MHDLHKQVEVIANELTKWTARTGGGLLHVTPDDMRERNKDIESQLKNRRWNPASDSFVSRLRTKIRISWLRGR